ncbi:hypothetical protein GPY51_10880 [Photorhabdus laumondii subsp. laumondii]|uniref:Uncharacterized protein n=1 Tax=Photorhabdus laumondii subsp. laumondii TaxID=141679 RepID=A0A6L9JIW2_PHOLM|nr:hypothetical protein [Photorhabdus laumondii]MCC8384621.1 hypothetical protein [Photorhabdus laumondii]MCC8413333.1 hypothetical protein [Photorhabdus laumondii]NDK94999.1 hypothetical protein [Photorhabdus laumondii subsp. laumondii]NDL21291.1 hypothetical protein [Photorhabdus laumondii subsp. laumondii]NDL30213.1 hypothetical protein [Photorhabdus laumondii subsp. laumondii]
MTACIHAELMMQYAQDALRTDEPWELWECEYEKGEGFSTLMYHPSWFEGVIYRRKPEMITVGTVSFPKPVDYELDYGVGYFYPNLHSRGGDRHCEHFWSGNEIDCSLLKIGFIHLTKEAAQQHCDALIKISKGEF